MGRRRAGRDIHGILLLDKPAGISSNHALQRVRHLLTARKAGHSGTLDPFATGMLPICLGEASKTAAFMLEASKTYRAVVRLGQSTTTGDIEGVVIQEQAVPELDQQRIESTLSDFTGPIAQVPPMFSALKHQGQPLYKLARQGLSVERKPRSVTIHRLELISWDDTFLSFEVHCSKGTYIRTLGEDICTSLGTCGHLDSLRRLEVEPFDASRMVTMEAFEQSVEEGRGEELLLPLDAGLCGWPEMCLDRDAAERFCHGNPVSGGPGPGMVRVFGPDGKILGLGESLGGEIVRPKRVFVLTAET